MLDSSSETRAPDVIYIKKKNPVICPQVLAHFRFNENPLIGFRFV